MMFLAKEGITPLTLRYKASPELSTSFEPILARLGWSPPHTDFVLLEGRSHRSPPSTGLTLSHCCPLSPPPGTPSENQQRQPAHSAHPLNCNHPLIHAGSGTISLALLHHDALVGWLLAHRTEENSVNYSSLFVAPSHRGRPRPGSLLKAFGAKIMGLSRSLALLFNAATRQCCDCSNAISAFTSQHRQLRISQVLHSSRISRHKQHQLPKQGNAPTVLAPTSLSEPHPPALNSPNCCCWKSVWRPGARSSHFPSLLQTCLG